MGALKKRQSGEANGFVRVAPSDDVREGEQSVVRVGKRSIILTRLAGDVYAVDASCPHASADLSRGSLRQWRLCCPEHDYCFDIRTGRILWPEDENYRLKRYETREEDGSVFVRAE